ncbi:hypothetical protein L6164_004156 [Bauhinia variegata]|uniref:Uncharacterized protein n=1 Tax=Bauhinia variegata TaxID=167791 RepID=A0ACB9Q311_BAUVA|nr:hypothetical protein L6164_004156 [Bauhinia variegata]
MINHPEILEKATEELDNEVGKDRLVQESDFPKLNFVKACAREAFRLHPVVPYNLPHASLSDPVVGDFIPKGSHPDLNFISFSTGRRGCPGVMLGSSIIVMLFARLLRAFSWSAPPNESQIDLIECHDNICPAKPLVALAEPRFPLEVYLTV